MTKIAIIASSNRPGRRSVSVAEWVHREASGRTDATFDVVDLADIALPLLDEPIPAIMSSYRNDHTMRWSAIVDTYDGYVFVVPEYNHSIPAVLKNAIDYLYAEWANKAAGCVSYGVQGGIRAAEHLRLILAEMKVADVRTNPALSIRDDFLFSDNDHPDRLTPPNHHAQSLHRMLDEVVEWSDALAVLRTPVPLADATA